MSRKKLSIQTETDVLVHSRRRCCICYGLNNDKRVKDGQIAHLDHNSSNNELDNLAFLCFVHHNQYDSTTSQSKNLTILEVKHYRSDLLSYINNKWKITSSIVKMNENLNGRYFQGDDFKSSELIIKVIGNTQIQVTGYALYGKTLPRGPNMGQLDFVTEINNDVAKFEDTVGAKKYTITITFNNNGLIVEEAYFPEWFAYFGAGANFYGNYKKMPIEK